MFKKTACRFITFRPCYAFKCSKPMIILIFLLLSTTQAWGLPQMHMKENIFLCNSCNPHLEKTFLWGCFQSVFNTSRDPRNLFSNENIEFARFSITIHAVLITFSLKSALAIYHLASSSHRKEKSLLLSCLFFSFKNRFQMSGKHRKTLKQPMTYY